MPSWSQMFLHTTIPNFEMVWSGGLGSRPRRLVWELGTARYDLERVTRCNRISCTRHCSWVYQLSIECLIFVLFDPWWQLLVKVLIRQQSLSFLSSSEGKRITTIFLGTQRRWPNLMTEIFHDIERRLTLFLSQNLFYVNPHLFLRILCANGPLLLMTASRDIQTSIVNEHNGATIIEQQLITKLTRIAN